MSVLIDGYQVFKVTDAGCMLPVSGVFGTYRDAVRDKLRLRSNDGETYHIQPIINNNNSK